MKFIGLTQNQKAVIDDEDFDRINKYKWHASANSTTGKYYARGSIWLNKRTISFKMHRLILNAAKGEQVDHINGDTLDNRKKNLRICNNQQNQQNQIHHRKNNKLGIKGVYWDSERRKFRADIRVNGKLLCLGRFNILGDADSAYRIAEDKYFGEFSRNLIPTIKDNTLTRGGYVRV